MKDCWNIIIATLIVVGLTITLMTLFKESIANEKPKPTLSATFETTGSEEELIEWVQKYIVKWGNLCENRDFNAPNCEMFNNLRRR